MYKVFVEDPGGTEEERKDRQRTFTKAFWLISHALTLTGDLPNPMPSDTQRMIDECFAIWVLESIKEYKSKPPEPEEK